MRKLLLPFLFCTVNAVRQYSIINNCPSSIDVYINSELQGSLVPNGGQLLKNLADDFTGNIYTTVNGGNPNGVSATKAAFYGPYNFSYLIKDPQYFNVGVKITPIPSRGFCTVSECDTANCTTAWSSQPRLGQLPPPQPGAPPPSLFARCTDPATTYTVTFCPTGLFPNVTQLPNQIHPAGRGDAIGKCLDVREGAFTNGTPVQLLDCNGTPAQNWLVHRYRTKIQLAGTNFCLDAGSSPGNGVGMKIWKCFDNLPAQDWYWTDDRRIALTGKGLCLDVPNGNFVNGQQLQTWQCTDLNLNQEFEIFT